MEQITSNVFVETQVRGCNHGFVKTSDGLVMIDSPHKPSDAIKLKAEMRNTASCATSSTPSPTATIGRATLSSTPRWWPTRVCAPA